MFVRAPFAPPPPGAEFHRKGSRGFSVSGVVSAGEALLRDCWSCLATCAWTLARTARTQQRSAYVWDSVFVAFGACWVRGKTLALINGLSPNTLTLNSLKPEP